MRVKRKFFILLLLLFSFFIWKTWKINDIKIENINFKEIQSNNIIKSLSNIKNEKKIIYVKTDTVSLAIDLNNGNIKNIQLLKYQSQLHSLKKLELLNKNKKIIYEINNNFVNLNKYNHHIKKNIFYYSTKNAFFKLANNQKILYVPIFSICNNGIKYTKTFILKKGSYDINIEYKISNFSSSKLNFSIFDILKEKINLKNDKNIYEKYFTKQDTKNLAYSVNQKQYNKCSLEDILNNRNLFVYSHYGWIALLQQYFTVASIFNNCGSNIIHTYHSKHQEVIIEHKFPNFTILSGHKKVLKGVLWAGPNIQSEMSVVSPNLDLIIDYGWLWFLSKPLLYLLKFLHHFLKNWGISIILITLIIRLLTFPLAKSQYLSIAKMKVLEPDINFLKKKYKNDRKKLNQAILMLYKDKKVNPFGSFISVFIQMPIFISLYSMLVNSIELRHAPFILWIYDLSDRDPFYILPILMGITMFYIQKTSPSSISSDDIIQRNIINIIPIVFVLFFLYFPSGLVLYYIISNLVTIMQQCIIYSTFKKNAV